MAHRKKTGGRQEGTPNRTTAQIRDLLQSALGNYMDGQFHLDIMAVDPETRLRFNLELAKLITPKPPTILGFEKVEQPLFPDNGPPMHEFPIFTGIDLNVIEPPAPFVIELDHGADPALNA